MSHWSPSPEGDSGIGVEITLRSRRATIHHSSCCSSLPPTFAEFLSCHTAGSSPTLPAAAFVALMRSPRALATSFTALMSTTCVGEATLVCEREQGKGVRLWTELGMLGRYLSFWVFRSQAGCTKLDDISETGNGGH